MTVTFRRTSRRNLEVSYRLDAASSVEDLEAGLGESSFCLQGRERQRTSCPQCLLVQGSSLVVPSLEQQDNDTTSFVVHKTLPTYSGLVGTVLTAFNLHQNLQIRPDDVWVAILVQFSSYVNARAEELRDRLVDFDDQMNLEVVRGGTLATADLAK